MSCRLLYLVGQLGVGGLEQQLCYLLQAMDRERYKPAVVAWNYCKEDTHVPPIRALDVPLYSLRNTDSSVAKLSMFLGLVKQLEPEVIHSYSFYTNIAAYLAARDTRAIGVGSVRHDFTWGVKETGPWLGRLCARWPRDQIYNSHFATETSRHSGSFFIPRQIYVVRNGLDLERFQSVPLATDGQVRILGVGNLRPAKRWDRLLVAVRELKQRGFDCLIQIAGDGPLLMALEQQAQDLKVADCVEFIGYADNVPGLLANATFLVHTAENEGCPNAVMEAMACGRAVVATDAGDVPFLIEDGKTGFVVRRGDNTTLVEHLATLISDRDLCRSMGKAGRVKAEREFNLDRLVGETLAVYQAAGWKDA